MAFKGTRSRNCLQIDLDAERLGADVNAHADKGHTAIACDPLRGERRDRRRLGSRCAERHQ